MSVKQSIINYPTYIRKLRNVVGIMTQLQVKMSATEPSIDAGLFD